MLGTPRVMRECLDSIPDPVVSRDLTLFNCLMSGLLHGPATIIRVLSQNFGIPNWRSFHDKVYIRIAPRRRPRRT